MNQAGTDLEWEFFNRFIAFDCTDRNDGFDRDSIQWFCPAEMAIVIKRLEAFGGRATGMDVAEYFGPGKGARGKSWGIVAGVSERDFGGWMPFLARETTQDCLLSISYAIPDEMISLFIRQTISIVPAQTSENPEPT
jgi:hypothetical protein